jgi:hypothetical protein
MWKTDMERKGTPFSRRREKRVTRDIHFRRRRGTPFRKRQGKNPSSVSQEIEDHREGQNSAVSEDEAELSQGSMSSHVSINSEEGRTLPL